MTNMNALATGTRSNTADAYKCVEVDPDTVAADGNIHIDVETGAIQSSTLTDILAERAALSRMVQPSQNAKPYYGIYTGYILACLIAFGTAFGLWWFIFSNDTGARFYIEMGLAFVICVLVLVGGGLGLFGKTNEMRMDGIYTAGAGFIVGFLYYLYFFVYNPPNAECGTKSKAARTTATGIPTATATATDAETANKPYWIPYWMTLTPVQIAITGGIFGVLGFLGGTII